MTVSPQPSAALPIPRRRLPIPPRIPSTVGWQSPVVPRRPRGWLHRCPASREARWSRRAGPDPAGLGSHSRRPRRGGASPPASVGQRCRRLCKVVSVRVPPGRSRRSRERERKARLPTPPGGSEPHSRRARTTPEECVRRSVGGYLVDPASSHMLVSKTKPCMSKYERFRTVKLRMAH